MGENRRKWLASTLETGAGEVRGIEFENGVHGPVYRIRHDTLMKISLAKLRSAVAGTDFYQKQETAEQLSDLQKSVNQLLESGKIPDTEDNQPLKKPAQKN